MAIGGDELRSAPREHVVFSIQLRGRFHLGAMRFLDRSDGFRKENGCAANHFVSGGQGCAGRNQLSEGRPVKAGQIQRLQPQRDRLPAHPMRQPRRRPGALLQVLLQGDLILPRQPKTLAFHDVLGLCAFIRAPDRILTSQEMDLN